MASTTNKLTVVTGDGTLGVHGDGFDLLFSYERGGLESLRIGETEWLYRVPRPAFWRATTDNDRGNRFSEKSAQWLGADQFSTVKQISVTIDDAAIELPIAPINNQYGGPVEADNVRVIFTYETATVPRATVMVRYAIDVTGDLAVTADYLGAEGLPELPAFGLRFVVPEVLSGFSYEGLSGETYPDRMRGGEHGVYDVSGLPVTPYLVPQEMAMHMNTDWVTLHHGNGGLLHAAKQTDQFAFSMLPYEPMQLEAATHLEELPAPRRTIFTVYGAVRGVGGIDSWGSDVEPQYRLPADRNYHVQVVFKLA